MPHKEHQNSVTNTTVTKLLTQIYVKLSNWDTSNMTNYSYLVDTDFRQCMEVIISSLVMKTIHGILLAPYFMAQEHIMEHLWFPERYFELFRRFWFVNHYEFKSLSEFNLKMHFSKFIWNIHRRYTNASLGWIRSKLDVPKRGHW